ncbi:mechanosensitive ion channel domain-containing protein [Halobacteriovorax sp. JY17]|uniref:mechanosensitive ion channel family protein n=1 Tax=Halobacteriovorax sp. JY17 TaxID=2014617 RepID=UPI000C385A36|nr:mechanosensitive ion channel domain-containing protein [Halobacteriovorax sp. JY17]PIK15443.1 MAG: transporter [Halobacteriovorax sp. JY17]
MTWLKTTFKYISMPLFEISGNKISLISILLAVGVFFLTTTLAKMSEKFMDRFLADKGLDTGVRGSIVRITRYIVLFVGLMITLDTVGISLSSLAALGAVLMVGIGFGLQNITQNFISGLIILFERPVKVGDFVSVKDISGRVVEIGARSTLIHTRDDVAIIVPNSQFISEQVINQSFTGETMRMTVDVGVAYGSDTANVKKVLLEVAGETAGILIDPPPKVFFENFGDSALQFSLAVWINDIWDNRETLSNVRLAIDKRFREEKISIPFPQRDIHIIKEA